MQSNIFPVPGLQVKNAKKQHVRNLGPAFDAVAKGKSI